MSKYDELRKEIAKMKKGQVSNSFVPIIMFVNSCNDYVECNVGYSASNINSESVSKSYRFNCSDSKAEENAINFRNEFEKGCELSLSRFGHPVPVFYGEEDLLD